MAMVYSNLAMRFLDCAASHVIQLPLSCKPQPAHLHQCREVSVDADNIIQHFSHSFEVHESLTGEHAADHFWTGQMEGPF